VVKHKLDGYWGGTAFWPHGRKMCDVGRLMQPWMDRRGGNPYSIMLDRHDSRAFILSNLELIARLAMGQRYSTSIGIQKLAFGTA
jgi:hypothetical protein